METKHFSPLMGQRRFFSIKQCLRIVLLVTAVWLLKMQIGFAGAPPVQEKVQNGQNADCLMCHSDHDFKGTLEDGEMISLYVDRGEYGQSIHSTAGLECIACHTIINQYPHQQNEQVSCISCHPAKGGTVEAVDTVLRVQLPYKNRRELALSVNNSCRTCHEEEFNIAEGSAHARMMESGNVNAPVCIDCHGSHNITKAGQPRDSISRMCGNCHKAVYSTYRTSVHGAALSEESNPDVPSCTDCHGVHNVRGPRDSEFRNDSITICGDCHANTELMSKYGISTAVFQTYLDDFHGQTVDLFRRQGTRTPSDKAVCYDCHGIHNIRKPDDPLSTVYPANLQHTCQQCHTDASIRFPQAWVSHYIPSWEHTPVLYAVNVAYKYGLIPFTMGFFFLYIGLDVRKRWSDKRKKIHQAIEAAKEAIKDDYNF